MSGARRFFAMLLAVMVAGCGADGGTDGAAGLADSVAMAIHEVQGAGTDSPVAGQTVSIRGIVSGDYQHGDADAANDVGGFFVQSLTPDRDPASSEGVFVYDRNAPFVDVSTGDRVTVVGTVKEHFGETQLAATRVRVDGSGTLEPVDVNLPADLERFEGMLVRLPQTLTVSDHFELERFGTVQLSAGGRPFQFTNQNAPDVAGYRAHRAALAARSILLDDGRSDENVTPIRFLAAGAPPDYSLRAGDTITGLTGVLRFARGSGGSGREGFRVLPTAAVRFERQNPRPGVPDVGGNVRVASFNALNLFSGIDSGQGTCGPGGKSGCRGADSNVERERQLAKLATALAMIDADIVGLMEVENDAGVALQLLVDRLNIKSGRSYDVINTGTVGRDAITTGFIYNGSTVAPVGSAVILDSTVDDRFNDERNRPAIAQAFKSFAEDAVFSVVVNHLKSKGSDCDSLGDPNTGDGQANCNLTRSSAAAALADWVATDPTGSGDDDYLVIGDLNAYTFEDPLTALKNGGLTSLLEEAFGGEARSFIFDSQSGALDHALASAALAPQVSGIAEWHINADEPDVLDYNTEFGRDPSLFDATTPWRASDHDPVIIGLQLIN